MTEYGERIVVNGVKPDWLRDEIGMFENDYDEWLEEDKLVSWGWYENTCPISIRLPATHNYYTVQRYNAEHGTSFVYWPGGDSAPDDFGGIILNAEEEEYDGTHGFDWKYRGATKIIGYTRQPATPDTETVTLRKMSEAEARALYHRSTQPRHLNSDAAVAMLVNLGLIRTPTRAETIAAKSGVAVDVVERVLGVMGDE